MIGYPITGDTTRVAVVSLKSSNRIADSAVVYNQRYGIGAKLALFRDSIGASDHVPFLMAGYDAFQVCEGSVFEIWGGKNPYYHTPHDSLDKLHPGLMRRAAQLMLATVAELAHPVGQAPQVSAPTNLVLEQNYPNPLNSQTVLRFKTPRSTFVKVKVYDLLGREVATIFQGDLDAGPHSFNWEARGVSSGLYFFRVQAGDITETKKMLLLR